MNPSSTNNDENHFALRGAAGFTLTEILIVIAIFGLLALIWDQPTQQTDRSQFTDGVHNFINNEVRLPLLAYRMDIGRFPSTIQGLSALMDRPADEPKWKGPYLTWKSKALLDPWSHSYHYQSPGTHNPNGYDVWSDGPDGVSGTSDDIGNWENPVTTQ